MHSFAVVQDTVECCGNKLIVCKCRTGNIETINIRHGVRAGAGAEVGPRGTEDNGGDRRQQETQAGARGTLGDTAALLISRPRPRPAPALQPTLNTERVAGELVTREYTVS